MASCRTIDNIIKDAVTSLTEVGISRYEAQSEVYLLMEHILGFSRKDVLLNPHATADEDKLKTFNETLKNRLVDRIPVQYLIGRAHFFGREFVVTPDVLIPRADTETLVHECLLLIKSNRSIKTVVDIGTGSGCIALSIAANVNDIEVVACDVSEKALAVAKMNTGKLGLLERVRFVQSDLLGAFEEKFDLIVSNPPYIAPSLMATLEPEVIKHEPHLALFAEDPEGVDFYRRIIEQAKSKLNSGGYIAFEVGIDQADSVRAILEEAGFSEVRKVKDFNNIDRVVIAKR